MVYLSVGASFILRVEGETFFRRILFLSFDEFLAQPRFLQGVLVVILNKSTMTPCEQMNCRPTTTPPYPPTSVKSDFYIHIFEKYLSFLMYILYL